MPRCTTCDPSHLILDASSVYTYIWDGHFRPCRLNGEKQESQLSSSIGKYNLAFFFFFFPFFWGGEWAGEGEEYWNLMLKSIKCVWQTPAVILKKSYIRGKILFICTTSTDLYRKPESSYRVKAQTWIMCQYHSVIHFLYTQEALHKA